VSDECFEQNILFARDKFALNQIDVGILLLILQLRAQSEPRAACRRGRPCNEKWTASGGRCVYRKLCMDGARGAREKLTFSEAFGCGHVFGL
jgi:hypothetical protein